VVQVVIGALLAAVVSPDILSAPVVERIGVVQALPDPGHPLPPLVGRFTAGDGAPAIQRLSSADADEATGQLVTGVPAPELRHHLLELHCVAVEREPLRVGNRERMTLPDPIAAPSRLPADPLPLVLADRFA